MDEEKAQIEKVTVTLNRPMKSPQIFNLSQGICRSGDEYYFYDEKQNVLTFKMENGHLTVRLSLDD